MTRLLALAAAIVVSAAAAATARADGLPVEGVDLSRSGIPGTAAGAPRYVSLPAGRDTVVAAVSQDGGQVLRSRLLEGRFTIPAVAYDGSPGGLSADGRTLVLINPRVGFPRHTTTLAVVGTVGLRARDVIALEGDFSFDAVSPDGRWLYLVQYLSKRDPTRYLVRLYDLRRGRLLPEPIIDPREVGDVMRGMPITRAASPDGRFAYTLYDGAGGHPFIHALDTVGRTARCIDLHGLMDFEDLYRLKLDVSPGGDAITVVDGSDPMAFVDTRTNEVTDPAELVEGIPTLPEPEPRTRAAPESAEAPADEGAGFPWFPVAFAGVIVLLALTRLKRFPAVRLRRLPPQPPAEWVISDGARDGANRAGRQRDRGAGRRRGAPDERRARGRAERS
jgi:hypothetical protein